MAFAQRSPSKSRSPSRSTPIKSVRPSFGHTQPDAAAAASAAAKSAATGSASKYMAKKEKVVSEQKLALNKSKNLLGALPTVDAFSWHSTLRGTVSDVHTAAARVEQAASASARASAQPPSSAGGGGGGGFAPAPAAAPQRMRSVVNKVDPPSSLGPASKMEQLNASMGTSFGNRVRCSPENPSKPGDGAHLMSKVKVFVSKGSQDSTVKDLIFAGAGQAAEDSPAGKAAKALLASQVLVRL
jgi:hypothetical protein